ncbi:phage P22-like portal protein [Pseudoduganella flava]|uniref:Phage P22-like portal protein n=1 Tax=Pseudoduganella flava TaxID=871742 RepID=A0A562P9Z2_9BURK|nr:portal protein [Pseudoduganella flava]QGZ42707.1 hypothetical protein GO485_29190 [Pseudoduganella flava]TWI41040.1 phage P22-like portal protein [Pseudoduganella flava]
MASKDEELLIEARKALARARDRESENRENWLADVRFARLGEQWPEQIKQQRDREGRPCLTLNRLPAFIRQVTNDARQNTPSIKFHPVGDGADQETAKLLDGLVRNIEYTSDADVAYDNALENAVTGGFGYFRISTEYASDDAFDQDIRIEPIRNPLTVYGDPMSMAADSSDWNVAIVTEMWSRDEFKRKWPKADMVDFMADSRDGQDWFTEDEIRVAEYWKREEVPATLVKLSNGNVMLEKDYEENRDFFDVNGVTVEATRPTRTMKVTQYILSGCDVLETNDWPGKYIPIVPVYGDEVIIDGERHLLSLVRFAKDPQMMFNFWRTASTELVALAPKAPFIGAVGQFTTDAQKWATANTQTHQYIEYDAVEVNGTPVPPPQRQPFAGPPAGALQEALNASDDMKSIMGLFDASLGAKSNETSGRAILARQREGDVSTFNYIDNLSRGIRHAGRILCDLIPKVYSGPRMLRVIHEDGSNSHVAVNGMQPPQPDPQEEADTQAVLRSFDLTAGKYDVTCETGPSFTTRREEAAAQMVEFIRANPASAPIIGDLLAKNLDWPGADEIAERLKKMLPPQLQGQDPQALAAQQQMQQMAAQIQQLGQQLQAAEQDRTLDAAKVENDRIKVQIEAYKAETDRLQAMAPAASTVDPAAIQTLVLQTLQQVMTSPDITPPAPQQPAPPVEPQPLPPEGMQQ